MKEKQRQGERGQEKSDGHLGWLNIHVGGSLSVPQASLTATRRGMPGSDRCRTKGAFVYRYVPSLLPSLHPPILCFASTGDRPLPASVEAGAVWLIWMWWRRGEKKEGGRASGDWGLRWVRTQQAVLGGWDLSLSFSFFLFPPFPRHQVVCCPLPPAHLRCHSASPGQSARAMQITYPNTRRWGQTCGTRRLVNRRLKCHLLMSESTSAPYVPLK